MPEIEKLPDYPILKKLATTLWQQERGYQGAAIMVGAGFSRSASFSGDINKKMPLWADLSTILKEELEPSTSNSNSQRLADPLRLAEEYNAYFSKQALYDLIKKEVNDLAWSPGDLYNSLLKLPWTEVLTTNWDTLIERASEKINRPLYSIVNRQEELASTKSPRIVKLHGTINVTENLTFTQEDYRNYPQKHAAFVNFARQVFIENELCLLGFSGDDPNFLQWTGWVKDQLATNARKIYLVGALDLTASKRKYLESINIAPIDLADLVAEYDDCDVKHAKATKIFLDTLNNLKPRQAWEWTPSEIKDSSVEERIRKLASDRQSYPGWLVCPNMLRWELQCQVKLPFISLETISHLEPGLRSKLLYELVWRYRLTYMACPKWLIEELLKICDPSKECALSKKQQVKIAIFILKQTRWMDISKSSVIAESVSKIIESNIKFLPEAADELSFYQAIKARDNLDYVSFKACLDKISAKNPIYKLRKATLLSYLGLFSEGKNLLSEAELELLSQYRNAPNSIYILSRLVMVSWLLNNILWIHGEQEDQPLPDNYRERSCDPWDYIEHIRRRIRETSEKEQKSHEIESSFEPGKYRDNSQTKNFSNEVDSLLLFDGIINDLGLPIRWDRCSLLDNAVNKLASLDNITDRHRYSLAMLYADDETSDLIKTSFSRVQVACMSQPTVDNLLDICTKSIEFWLKKRSVGTKEQKEFALSRLRVFTEVLARISIRANPEQATSYFRLALKLGKKIEVKNFFFLSGSLKHLLDYTLKSIPKTEQHQVLLDALQFPLPTENDLKASSDEWVNLVVENPGPRKNNPNMDKCIADIIDRISFNSSSSSYVLLRLLPLIEAGFLKDEEKQKISDKIWGGALNGEELPETGLLKFFLTIFPSPNPDKTEELVKKYLFKVKDGSLFDRNLLFDIINAERRKKITPSASQALDYFNRMIDWRPNYKNNDLLGLSNQEEKLKGELIAQALSQSIVPSMSPSERSYENFQKVMCFYSEVGSPNIFVALSYFADLNDETSNKVEIIIKKGLQGQDFTTISNASFAIMKWRESSKLNTPKKLVSRLIYQISSNRIAELGAPLRTVNNLYNKDLLSSENIATLVEILPIIFDSTDYKNIPNGSKESISISLVRATCVRLVKDLLKKSEQGNKELARINVESQRDALPEVRYA